MSAIGLLLATVPTPSPAYSVSASHPRLWLTPARLATLRNYANRNYGQGTARWQRLKSAADTTLSTFNSGGPTALGDLPSQSDAIPLLGMAYQVTGNAAYARAAVQILVSIAAPTDTLSYDYNYYYRIVLPDVSAGYDWCFDQMSLAQRQQVATWLMDRADNVWPDTNPDQIGGWGVADAADNYFYGFLMTWPAALAVEGDGTDTHIGAVSGANRPAYHADLGLAKYRGLVRPFTDGWGRGGAFAESTNYDSTQRLSLILDAFLTATGTDLINESGFTFLHDSIRWRIHSTVPTKDCYYPLGDQTRVSLGSLSDYDRFRALIPVFEVNDSLLQQYGKSWLDSIDPPVSTWPSQVTWEFLYFNEDAPVSDYTAGEPLSYFAPGSGVLFDRSSWNTDATYFGIWAGPLQETHQNKDANGFMIYKGGWLTGNTTVWSHDGTFQETLSQNNLTFGGAGQAWQTPDATWPNEAGQVLKREIATDYTYFAGQAAQAYVQDRPHGGTATVNDYVRKFVYIPSADLFLVYDRVNLIDPTKAKEWHLHSHTPITINGRSYQFDNGTYRMFGQSVLPAAGTTLSVSPENNKSDGSASSYRLDAVTANNQVVDTLLNTLQVTPASQTSVPASTAVSVTQGAVEGAKAGNWVVMFGKRETVTDTVRYTVTSLAVTQNLALDLEPNATYSVALSDLNSSTISTSSVTTTPQGSLRFSVPAGLYQIQLTPPGAAPSAPIQTAAPSPSAPVATAPPGAQPPVSGQVLWLKADALSGLSDGTSVSSWTDSSGNGNTAQSIASQQPTFKAAGLNGKPAVVFNGSNSSLTTPAIGLGPFTQFIVLQAASDWGMATQHGYGNSYNGSWTDTFYTWSPALRVVRNGVESSKNAALTWVGTAPNVMVHRFDGTHAGNVLFVNGSPVSLTTNSGGGNDPGTSVCKAPLTIGSLAGTGSYFKGAVAEVLVYNRALSDAERGQVETYLGSKYGLK